MRKVIILLVVAAVVYGLEFYQDQGGFTLDSSTRSQHSGSVIEAAYENRQNDVQVQGQGRVLRILPDDNEGSRHQRFILELDTGQALLIAHNIDLAPRLSELNKGDTVSFYGEYEWNSKGGVIHWTHNDPNHRHIDGWLKHRGKTYQ
ncbi:MAG: DUF3465 domain-containing protein [Xanthomonadales bacterium]|nr:DUF3465 domain-containing protein [Xanthomonadales bacterium]